MSLGMSVKRLISKEIWKELERKLPRMYIFDALTFYLRVRGVPASTNMRELSARCSAVAIAVRIIRVIKIHRNELERKRRVLKKAHRQSGISASFSRRCFPFLGELFISDLHRRLYRFLFSLLAKINRAYNKVSRRRNGEIPSRGKWIAAGKAAAILSQKKTRVTRKNIPTRLIKSFLIALWLPLPSTVVL